MATWRGPPNRAVDVHCALRNGQQTIHGYAGRVKKGDVCDGTVQLQSVWAPSAETLEFVLGNDQHIPAQH